MRFVAAEMFSLVVVTSVEVIFLCFFSHRGDWSRPVAHPGERVQADVGRGSRRRVLVDLRGRREDDALALQ